MCLCILSVTLMFSFPVLAKSDYKNGEEINYQILATFNSKSKIKYSDKVEKNRSNIELKIIEKQKTDSGLLNSRFDKNNFESYFEYDEQNWNETESSITTPVKEIRKTLYPDGQFGIEALPINLEFDKKSGDFTKYQEYDLSGRVFDKNKPKLSKIEEDKLVNQFLAKYKNNPKKVSSETFSETVPKTSIAQREFFESKKNQSLSSKLDLNNQSIALFKNPFEVKVNAASTYDKYGAANYARWWGTGWNTAYPKYGSDCTNFASQATLAGGLKKDYNNNDTYSKDWYIDAYFSKSNTWSVATNYADHMYNHENTGPWQSINPSNAAYILDYGDLVFLNDSGGTHHVMMITGAYWASPDNRYHALYSQHTGDKSNADFDAGYYNSPGNVFWGLNIYGNVWDHI